MRIACLQFAPQVGDIDNNLNRADAVLSRACTKDLDLLVLPELAFSGYNFKSRQHVSLYVEPTASGITSLWARTTALKYNCSVMAGYPEKVNSGKSLEFYNSMIAVNSNGETVAHCRKSFWYDMDETWASDGSNGFARASIERLGNVAMGICMDLKPYNSDTRWSAWDFAYHILHKEANLVILSMAWFTLEDPRSFSRSSKEPDMETLSHWLARLEPIIRAETIGEITVVLANRTGSEDELTYAGTSAILGVNNGEVKVYGILGRGERDLLVVDTNKLPQGKLVSEPSSAASRITSTAPPSTTTDSRKSKLSPKPKVKTPKNGYSAPRTMSTANLGPLYLPINDQDMKITTDVVRSPQADCVSPHPSRPCPRDSLFESLHFNTSLRSSAPVELVERPPSPKRWNARRSSTSRTTTHMSPRLSKGIEFHRPNFEWRADRNELHPSSRTPSLLQRNDQIFGSCERSLSRKVRRASITTGPTLKQDSLDEFGVAEFAYLSKGPVAKPRHHSAPSISSLTCRIGQDSAQRIIASIMKAVPSPSHLITPDKYRPSFTSAMLD